MLGLINFIGVSFLETVFWFLRFHVYSDIPVIAIKVLFETDHDETFFRVAPVIYFSHRF